MECQRTSAVCLQVGEVGEESDWRKCSVCQCESFSQRYSEKARCLLVHCAGPGLVQLCGKWHLGGDVPERQLLSRVVFLWITATAHQAPLRVSVLEQMRAGRLPFLQQQFV